MARTVTQAFADFKTNLEITTLQGSTVSTRQRNVRLNIAKELTVADDFLTGSYQRSTMIAPLRDADVDVFIVLDSSYYSAQPTGPANVLARVKRAIDKSYSETTESSRNGQAITIKFSDFKVDVVPAFNRQGGGYLIPDPNERRWIETNPKEHVRLWSESNQNRSYMLVPLLKMLKAWNRAHSQLLRSFHLEAMAREIFSYRSITSYPEAAATFFGDAEVYVTWVSDPAGYGGNLGSYALNNSSLASSIKDRLRTAKQKADEAISYNASGYNELAVNKWRVVFGDYFPSYG